MIGIATGPILLTTRKHPRRLLRDEAEKDDTVIIPEMHQRRAPMERATVSRKTKTKMAIVAKSGRKSTEEEEDLTEADDTLDESKFLNGLVGGRNKRHSWRGFFAMDGEENYSGRLS